LLPRAAMALPKGQLYCINSFFFIRYFNVTNVSYCEVTTIFLIKDTKMNYY
jgi:hypothetical protein